VSYADLLNTHQFELCVHCLFTGETQLNRFADALHQGIESLCLSVAAVKGGYRGDVITLFVTFYDNGKFSLVLHGFPLRAILSFPITSFTAFTALPSILAFSLVQVIRIPNWICNSHNRLE